MTEDVNSGISPNSTPQDKKDALSNWGYIVFVTACTVSFFVALVFALEFPLKFALILGLTPVGIGFSFLICFFCVLKWDFTKWRQNYQTVFGNENYTRLIKSVLLPVLLVGLYFYIKEEDESGNILYAKSPISCDMTIHPCGSSYYKRTTNVWDAADLISQPSENEVFIVTNAVVDRQQSRGVCGQTGAYCSTGDINPGRRIPRWLLNTAWIFSHDFRKDAIWNPIQCPDEEEFSTRCKPGVLYDNGIQTEECEKSQRFCNIHGWCPPIKMTDFEGPERTFQTEDFTIFLDLKPNFPEFHGVSWSKGGENGYSANYAEIYAKHHSNSRSVFNCVFSRKDDPYCPRFRLQEIVLEANNGDADSFNKTATYGGMIKIEVEWKCQFDWGSDIFDCLPHFRFLNRATNNGKPKIYPKVTSQDGNNRTVSYILGVNISIAHVGVGQQIQLFSLVLYAQFVYISFHMIKSPFIWVVRCLIATVLTANGK